MRRVLPLLALVFELVPATANAQYGAGRVGPAVGVPNAGVVTAPNAGAGAVLNAGAGAAAGAGPVGTGVGELGAGAGVGTGAGMCGRAATVDTRGGNGVSTRVVADEGFGVAPGFGVGVNVVSAAGSGDTGTVFSAARNASAD